MSDENKVYRMIKEFADEQPLIGAVHEGMEPEGEFPMYYFLTDNPQHLRLLEDAITGLELQILHETGEDVRLMRWPIPPARAHEYSFIGELIYHCE